MKVNDRNYAQNLDIKVLVKLNKYLKIDLKTLLREDVKNTSRGWECEKCEGDTLLPI